jgi:dihydrofolate synthase/folylpolyglutamate synthase
MNSKDIQNHLFSLNNRGIKYDLNRIRCAADECGNPQKQYKSFHIAGTNGKGSTSSYIESVCRQSGYRTGLFTSPHIVDFGERFIINGKPVITDEWVRVYHDLQNVIDKYELTFFEASTLMAFEIFKRNNIEWAIFETGMGGRLDATNIIEPEVSVITNIAMDHTDYLGNTLALIAGEKSGIIKSNIPCVAAFNQSPDVNDVITRTCAEKNASLTFVSPSDAENVRITFDGNTFVYRGVEYQTSLRGKFQMINSLLALNALRCAGITEARAVVEGLKETFIPGRCQIVKVFDKTVILDVGHNPDAAFMLADTIKNLFGGKSICLVTGIMKDKDTSGILSIYRRFADTIILTRPDIARAAEPEIMEKILIDSNFTNSRTIIPVANAINQAMQSSEEIVCITGSFYTVGEAYAALGYTPFCDIQEK